MTIDDTDFSVLYRALGLRPDCSFEQLRHAYRREVRRLHPDSGGSPAGNVDLQRLTWLYGAVIKFHRAHGRLPGARLAPVASNDRVPATYAVRAPAVGDALESRMASSRRRLRYMVIAGVVLIALLWLYAAPAPRPLQTSRGLPDTQSQAENTKKGSNAATRLAPGMDATQVQAILGPPLRRFDARWDYGPSWVAFRCGRVSGWYSSPLRPLGVDSRHPERDAAAEPHC